MTHYAESDENIANGKGEKSGDGREKSADYRIDTGGVEMNPHKGINFFVRVMRQSNTSNTQWRHFNRLICSELSRIMQLIFVFFCKVTKVFESLT